MTRFHPQRLTDLAEFARLQIESQDIDPAYPVLRELQRGLHGDVALWHTVLYLAHYHIGSAELAFGAAPTPEQLPEAIARLPTGVERRNLRGGKVNRHLASVLALAEHYGGLGAWLMHGLVESDVLNWFIVRRNYAQAWGNGRWATYKAAEVLWKVNGFPLRAPDMGIADSSGPREGLMLLVDGYLPQGNSPRAVAAVDWIAEELRSQLAERGVQLGIEQLETVLCDYHALYFGRYYPGHDIDLMWEQADAVRHYPRGMEALNAVLRARRASLPPAWVGEATLNPWFGVDKARRSVYRDSGKLVRR